VSYFVLWSIVTNSCGGLNPFIGFGCPDGSPMELIDSFTVADDGYDPVCHETGPSEGICTEKQPSAVVGSFIIQTGVIFRCYGNKESEMLGWATIPDQLVTCGFDSSTAYHAAAISLVRDYQGENEEIAKDYDCSIGFSTLTDGSQACADLTGSFGVFNLRELTVTQNTPIPPKFIEPATAVPTDPPSSPPGSTCFSGSNMVEVQGKGYIRMDSLKIGDYVKSADDKFSRVYSFGHMDHELKVTYVQIHAPGLEPPIEISPEHLLYVGDDKIVPARDVVVGDMLSGDKKVSKIKMVERVGAYAPITEEGSVFVSDVKTSCYVALLDYSPAALHWLAHAVLSPKRTVCHFHFDFCKSEGYTEGLSNYLHDIIAVVIKVAEFSIPVQLGITAVAALAAVSPIIMVALCIGFVVNKKTKETKK
jgi:hypothetical protein